MTRLRRTAEALPDGAFAVVMATGVVSLACRHVVPVVSDALLGLAVGELLATAALVAWRTGTAPGGRERAWWDAVMFVAAAAVVAAGLRAAGHPAPATGAPGLVWGAAVAVWGIALVIYLPMTLPVARGMIVRALAGRFRADDWIVMGALAISTLAAAALLEMRGAPARPEIRVLGLVTWMGACAWTPVLARLDIGAALRGGPGLPTAERWARRRFRR